MQNAENQLDNKIEALARALTSLKTVPEMKRFLRDIATYRELETLAERLEVAKRIVAGETYRSISTQTGASTTTVTRVAHWIHHGKGGYQLVIGHIHT